MEFMGIQLSPDTTAQRIAITIKYSTEMVEVRRVLTCWNG